MAFSVQQIRGLYDFRSHFAEIGGHRCHYLDEGSGEPMVMIHGNPSWSFMYRDLVRDLRSDFRVIAPDHIGCGLSDKPADALYPYTLERRVQDLEELLEKLGADSNLTLVAHDWGGIIGMTWAVRHPDRIARLVLFNTAAFLLPSWKSLHWTLRFSRDSKAAAFLIRRFNLFAWAASWIGCRKKRMRRQVREAYTGPYDSFSNRIATLRFVQDIPLAPSDRAFPTLRETERNLTKLQGVPTLICWGEKDFVFDRDFLAEWERRFPDAEIHRFSEAGHYVLEDESERIVPLVRRFIARHPLKPQAA